MYSSLAGFVEPGETIENAVRRETREESDITVGRVRYHASQPWPMPHQLMIGCYGEAMNFDITFDTAELEDCRWFTRDEIGRMLSEGSADGRTLPIQGTIARRLIEDWYEWRH
jgi:NAD+ diphosphatase